MDGSTENYRQAEQALLASEGVVAEERIVDLERLGGRLRVLVAGDGPPVVFVPGVITGGAVFAGLVGRLPEYQCIMIDRPGTGLSPVLPGQSDGMADVERIADGLLVDLLDGMGIEQADMVCTSLGGWIGFRSAAAHPYRFRRIAALAFQIGAPMGKVPLFIRMPQPPAALFPKRLRVGRGIVRAVLKSWGMRTAIETGKFSDELLDWIVALLRNTNTFGSERFNPVPALPSGPNKAIQHQPGLLAKITAPVHLFWGTEDVFAGVEPAEKFAAMLPDAHLQMVDGAGHAPWVDEPELAADAVRRHFTA